MNYGNCSTTWVKAHGTEVCPNCGKRFREGERVRISSTGLIHFIICGNGVACQKREQAAQEAKTR